MSEKPLQTLKFIKVVLAFLGSCVKPTPQKPYKPTNQILMFNVRRTSYLTI